MLLRNLVFCISSSLFLCLTACNSVKSILGFDHEGPQEFDVIPLAPLSLPADFKKTPKTQEQILSQTQEPSTESKNLQSVVLTEEEKKVVLASSPLQSYDKKDKEISKVLFEEVPERQEAIPFNGAKENAKETKKEKDFDLSISLNKSPAQQTLKTEKKIEKTNKNGTQEIKGIKESQETNKNNVNKRRKNQEIPSFLTTESHSKTANYSPSASSSSYKFLDELKIETDLFPTTNELKQTKEEASSTKNKALEGDFQSQVSEQEANRQLFTKEHPAPQKTEEAKEAGEAQDSVEKATQSSLKQKNSDQTAQQEVSLPKAQKVKSIKTSFKKNLYKKKKNKKKRPLLSKRRRSQTFQLKNSSKKQRSLTAQKKRQKSSRSNRRIRKIATPKKRQKNTSVTILKLDSSVS